MMPKKTTRKLRVSVSQCKTYIACELSWWFTYGPMKDRSPPTKATILGSSVHDVIEKWYEGKELPDTQAGRIASVGLSKLPAKESVLIEKSITIPLNEDANILCRIDMMGKDKFYIGDHKTTSDLKWAKTAQQIKYDVQLLTYAYAAYHKEKPDQVEVELIYYRTRGVPISMSVKTVVDWKDVEENWKNLGSIASEMAPKVNDPDGSSCKPNTDSCSMYGGCYHAPKCPFSPINRKKSKNHFKKTFKRDITNIDENHLITIQSEKKMPTHEEQSNKVRSMFNLGLVAPTENKKEPTKLEKAQDRIQRLNDLYKGNPPQDILNHVIEQAGITDQEASQILEEKEVSILSPVSTVESQGENTMITNEKSNSCTREHQIAAGEALRDFVHSEESVSVEKAKKFAQGCINANLTEKRWGRILQFSTCIEKDGQLTLHKYISARESNPLVTNEAPKTISEPVQTEDVIPTDYVNPLSQFKMIVFHDCAPFNILDVPSMATYDFVQPFADQIVEETGKTHHELNLNYQEGDNRLKAKINEAARNGYFEHPGLVVFTKSGDAMVNLVIEKLRQAGALVVFGSGR